MTGIPYLDETWNPITGCTPCSDGCKHCWSMRMARRLAGRCGYPDDPGTIVMHYDRLEQPTRWKKPRRVGVCFMGDLWHEAVTHWMRQLVFEAAQKAPQHTYYFLTKRPENILPCKDLERDNWLIGVTIESPQYLYRLTLLTEDDPHSRNGRFWVSAEPLLGPMFLRPDELDRIDWLVIGCESISGRVGRLGPFREPRQFNGHVAAMLEAADSAGVPVYVKQIPGDDGRVYTDPKDFPPVLRRRDEPRPAYGGNAE